MSVDKIFEYNDYTASGYKFKETRLYRYSDAINLSGSDDFTAYQYQYDTSVIGNDWQKFWGNAIKRNWSRYYTTVNGGSGDNTISANGGHFHFVGWNDISGTDHDVYDKYMDFTFRGGAGNDSLIGGAGWDHLYGGDDNDTLTGNGGHDYLYGDGGNDTLYGGDGSDDLWGGANNDLLYGNNGSDEIYGNNGTDTLYGGADGDKLWGNNGNDILYGEAGNDTLHGGENIDELYGGDGSDKLFGDAGNDVLVGGAGKDTLNGGAGDDLFYIDVPTSASAGDNITGGTGADTLFIGGTTMTTTTTTTKKSFDWGGLFEETAPYLVSGVASLFGADKAGTLLKGATTGIIQLFKGMNGAGTETSTVVDIPSNIATGTYVQVTDFNPREDVLVIPVDSQVSNVGYTTTSDGTLEVYNKNSGSVLAELSLEGLGTIHNNSQLGTDTTRQQKIWNSVLSSKLELDAYAGAAKIGSMALDSSNSSGNVTTTVTQLDASYVVIGAYSGANVLGTAEGGNTNLWGTNYSDVLISYETSYVGGDLKPEDSNGGDTLYGFDGDDFMAAGGGADYYYGGDGFDVVSYADEQFDAASSEGITVKLGQIQDGSASDYSYLDPGSDVAVFSSATDAYGYTDKLFNIEGIIGSKWDDSITGDAGHNVLNGGEGNDTLNGGNGYDILYGGDDADTLNGGGGTNTLYGEGGDDLLYCQAGDLVYGGTGADRFRLSNGQGSEPLIMDFNAAEGDTLEIDASAYGINSLGSVSYYSGPGYLLVSGSIVAQLDLPSGFSIDSSVQLV